MADTKTKVSKEGAAKHIKMYKVRDNFLSPTLKDVFNIPAKKAFFVNLLCSK